MNLSMQWLRDFCDCSDIDPKHFADVMTDTGSKVESVTMRGADIENVRVGKVLEMARHPDSDHLWICQVDCGESTNRQIVTGAQNVHVGDMVPVAIPPAKLPGNVVIKDGKLRGVESKGMMCSIGELSLTTHEMPDAVTDGILILHEPCKPGDDICDVLMLRDTVVEFEITSNRADCLCVIGLAREAAASFDRPLCIPTPKVEHTVGDISDHFRVTVQDPALCPRYTAMAVKNVKIAPSPLWMRMRLAAAGVRPINNIVDITNYVMLEYGQPMHAFDAVCLDGNEIVVRRAGDREVFRTLDHTDRELDADMLVIADEKKPVALAGIMGGENSEITDNTQTVIFESACFDGGSVRQTAKKLGMRTEASARFEKGTDPENTVPTVQRACELVQELGAGEVVGGMIDVYPVKHQPVVLPLEVERINRFLGVSLDETEMISILEKLHFTVKDGMITVPSFRLDIGCMNDVAEEIIRIYGYNRITSTQFSMPALGAGLTPIQKYRALAAQTLCAMGLDEIMTFTFISPKWYDKIGMPTDDARRTSVRISNPLGEDTSIMRTTALPSLLEVLATNHSRHDEPVGVWELARVYLPRTPGTVTNDRGLQGTLPDERNHITMGMYENGDFYTMKGMVEALMTRCGIREPSFVANRVGATFHPGRCADVYSGETYLGTFGQIHPTVAQRYGFDCEVYAAEFDLVTMWDICELEKAYVPLPKFPAVTRDLAFVCDEDLAVGDIENVMKKGGGKLLESVRLFDIYRGAQIGEGKKSVAFNLSFRAPDRTLTDEEADQATKKVLSLLQQELGLTLRS